MGEHHVTFGWRRGAQLHCADCGSRDLEPVEHVVSKPKQYIKGSWWVGCNGCGWEKRAGSQVECIIAGTEHQVAMSRQRRLDGVA